MSTRCNILFRQIVDGKVQQKLLTYRHSDGYPTGVVPDLIDFLKWNQGRNDQFDYLLANYFYYSKRCRERQYEEFRKTIAKNQEDLEELQIPICERKIDGNNPILIGYGIDCDNILHVDIEYFYIVDLIKGDEIDNFSYNINSKIHCYKAGFTDWDTIITSDEFINTHKPFKVIEILDIHTFKYSKLIIPKKYRY
jgi:hypothetical protein